MLPIGMFPIILKGKILSEVLWERKEVDLYKDLIAFVLKNFIYCLQTHKYKFSISWFFQITHKAMCFAKADQLRKLIPLHRQKQLIPNHRQANQKI